MRDRCGRQSGGADCAVSVSGVLSVQRRLLYQLFAGESFYFYPTIVFYGEKSKEFGALLTDAIPEENAEIRTIPAGTYVVGYHKGAYEQIQDSFKRIKEWGRNLNLEDTILALNIIDQFVEQNNDNYSTRIEIRIADTK